MREYSYALSLVSKFLRHHLAADPMFLSRADLKRLVHLVNTLHQMEDGDPDRAERVEIRHHAHNLLKNLENA